MTVTVAVQEKVPARSDTLRNQGLISMDLRNRLRFRVMKDGGLDGASADAIIDETLTFLTLCGRHPERRFAPSKQVDIGWHAFILHTRDYAAFCQQQFGRFIHHEPTRPGIMDPTDWIGNTVAFMEELNIPFRSELWGAKGSDCQHPSGDCGTTDCSSEGPD